MVSRLTLLYVFISSHIIHKKDVSSWAIIEKDTYKKLKQKDMSNGITTK